jgi:hypothetical protein
MGMSAMIALKNLRVYVAESQAIGANPTRILLRMIDNLTEGYQDDMDAQYERGIGSEAIRTAFRVREEA